MLLPGVGFCSEWGMLLLNPSGKLLYAWLLLVREKLSFLPWLIAKFPFCWFRKLVLLMSGTVGVAMKVCFTSLLEVLLFSKCWWDFFFFFFFFLSFFFLDFGEWLLELELLESESDSSFLILLDSCFRALTIFLLAFFWTFSVSEPEKSLELKLTLELLLELLEDEEFLLSFFSFLPFFLFSFFSFFSFFFFSFSSFSSFFFSFFASFSFSFYPKKDLTSFLLRLPNKTDSIVSLLSEVSSAPTSIGFSSSLNLVLGLSVNPRIDFEIRLSLSTVPSLATFSSDSSNSKEANSEGILCKLKSFATAWRY